MQAKPLHDNFEPEIKVEKHPSRVSDKEAHAIAVSMKHTKYIAYKFRSAGKTKTRIIFPIKYENYMGTVYFKKKTNDDTHVPLFEITGYDDSSRKMDSTIRAKITGNPFLNFLTFFKLLFSSVNSLSHNPKHTVIDPWRV